MEKAECTVNGNDDSQSQSSTENFQEEKLQKLFKVLRPLLLNYLKPSQIITHLTFISNVSRIKKAERKSSEEATTMLLDSIAHCNEPEKWKKFSVAIKEAEFTNLYNICHVCEKNDFDFYIEIFKLLSMNFAEHSVDIMKLSKKMLQLESLTEMQFNKIDSIISEEGEVAAILEFISCLPSDLGKWFKDLLSVLNELQKTDLCTQMKEKESLLKVEFPENEDLSCKNQPDKNNEGCEKSDHTDKEEKVEKKQLHLRKYQNELLEEPRKGRNCVISAPTGSGKTILALKLIEEHLAQKDNQIHKVVFLANQVALVQQQGRLCKAYLHQYSTCIVTGNNDISDGDISLADMLKFNDIIVLTPQILLNNLIENRLQSRSLSQFSLMIFDECHHTNKKHPYNGLMGMYLDEKLGENNSFLPQIVGLTASIGVGGASTIDEAVDYIQMICANLDCDEICTIKENRQDLFKHINIATDEIIIVPALSEDPFKDELNGMMNRVENEFMDSEVARIIKEEVPELNGKLKEHSSEREKPNYTNWLGDIKKYIIQLKSPDVRWRCLDCWTFLDIYHNALLINDSCRIKDAISYIQTKLENASESSIYKSLQGHWDQKVTYFQQLSKNPKYLNPLLIKLEEIILETIEKNSDSRIFIFLKSRVLVSALENWIKESKSLKTLNPQQLVGGSKRIDNQGMTTQQQEQKLSEFRLGNCQIMVATLGEEGLDIEKCNLVLNYNYVKNEISLVQKRGRARAENSKYITLAKDNSGISEREFANRTRERMMEKALERVQQLKNEDPQGYVKIKEELQKKEKSLRDFEHQNLSPSLQPGEYQLRCLKCDTFLCSSLEVRSIHKSQHTLLNDDFELKISVEQHPRPKQFENMLKLSKIYCRKCNNDLGIKALYKKHKFPIIKISSFILCDSKNRRIYERKWKNVPFHIKELTPEEYSKIPISKNAND